MTIREQYKAAWQLVRYEALDAEAWDELCYHANPRHPDIDIFAIDSRIYGDAKKQLLRRNHQAWIDDFRSKPFWIRMIGSDKVPLRKLSEVGRRVGVDCITVYACYEDYLAQRKDGVTYP